MNWEAVGAVGEVFGAFAVLVTLLYLSVQIRQNSSLARAELYNKAQERFSAYRAMVVAHPHIVLKMATPESLTPEELIVAQSLASEMAFNYAMLFENHRLLRLTVLMPCQPLLCISLNTPVCTGLLEIN